MGLKQEIKDSDTRSRKRHDERSPSQLWKNINFPINDFVHRLH